MVDLQKLRSERERKLRALKVKAKLDAKRRASKESPEDLDVPEPYHEQLAPLPEVPPELEGGAEAEIEEEPVVVGAKPEKDYRPWSRYSKRRERSGE